MNYNIIHALQAIGESVAVIERWGVEPEQFTELLSSTIFGGTVYTGYGALIARQAYTPVGFHVALGRKDLGLAADIAEASACSRDAARPHRGLRQGPRASRAERRRLGGDRRGQPPGL